MYLGRSLYRGVLAEKNILRCEDGQVTFRYTESGGATKTRTLAGAEFLWLLLQQVLPKGFRRTRDDGFLHGNYKDKPWFASLTRLVLYVCKYVICDIE